MASSPFASHAHVRAESAEGGQTVSADSHGLRTKLSSIKRLGSKARRAFGLSEATSAPGTADVSTHSVRSPRSAAQRMSPMPSSLVSIASASELLRRSSTSGAQLPSPSASAEQMDDSHPSSPATSPRQHDAPCELSSPTPPVTTAKGALLSRPKSLLSALLRKPSRTLLRNDSAASATSAQPPPPTVLQSPPATPDSSARRPFMVPSHSTLHASDSAPSQQRLRVAAERQVDSAQVLPLQLAVCLSAPQDVGWLATAAEGSHHRHQRPGVALPSVSENAKPTGRPIPAVGSLDTLSELARANGGAHRAQAMACPAAPSSRMHNTHAAGLGTSVASPPPASLAEYLRNSCTASASGGLGGPGVSQLQHSISKPLSGLQSAPSTPRASGLLGTSIERRSSSTLQASAASSCTLVATSASCPPAMMRSCWSLADYSLTKRLYKGSMASVYRGRCLRSGTTVALKVYFKNRVATNVIHQVLREVQIHLAASGHRNVLSLYGAFQDEHHLVMVQELAPRGDLAAIAGAMGGRATEVQLRELVLEPLLDALAHLHSKGICHRDLKPENLLFGADWGLRLADFGVSINLLEERAVTRAGTADYMAPEVERCPLKAEPEDNKDNLSLAYTTAADVWSIGILSYELLVGFPPVVGDSKGGGVHGFTNTSLSFPASVSPDARLFITAALAHVPEDRPTVLQLRQHPWLTSPGA